VEPAAAETAAVVEVQPAAAAEAMAVDGSGGAGASATVATAGEAGEAAAAPLGMFIFVYPVVRHPSRDLSVRSGSGSIIEVGDGVQVFHIRSEHRGKEDAPQSCCLPLVVPHLPTPATP